jgi:hypothetical protein
VRTGKIRWVLEGEGADGAGGVNSSGPGSARASSAASAAGRALVGPGGGRPGDSRAGSRLAIAAAAKACRRVSLGASTQGSTSNARGSTVLYDCAGRSAAIEGAA